MTDNLDIWNKLGRTNPEHTKKFTRGGGFKGTAIKPIYTDQKMTEVFGACGDGWGYSQPTFQLVPGSDGQTAVYCWLSIWYRKPNGERSEPVHGVGGDFAVKKFSSGLTTDDEAFKKAFTDALGNAMKHLGMSADVHMGLFDDNKYLAQVTREFAEPAGPPPMSVDHMLHEIGACSDDEAMLRLKKDPAFRAGYLAADELSRKRIEQALAKAAEEAAA